MRNLELLEEALFRSDDILEQTIQVCRINGVEIDTKQQERLLRIGVERSVDSILFAEKMTAALLEAR